MPDYCNAPAVWVHNSCDINKLHHIFGQARHNLDDLLLAAGNREAAFNAVENAVQSQVNSGAVAGRFKTTVDVLGQTIEVRGQVIDGVAKIGTFYKP